MSILTLQSTIRLSSGYELPRLGFGTAFGIGKEENAAEVTKPSLLEALRIGYRHVDGARGYNNEREAGEAIHDSNVPRSELFIISKVTGWDNTYEKASAAVDTSLKEMGLDYLDLYLIHNPPQGTKARLEMWQALIDAKKAGKVRTIGVSNYNIHHIKEIEDAGLELPSLNQLEIHPFCQQRPIVDYCTPRGILMQAYCCILRGAMDHHVIKEIAKKHNKDPGQILLRWSLQRGFQPLIRSSNPQRIKANCDLYGFNLDEEDMNRLNALDQGDAGSMNWNPIFVE